MAGAGVGVTVGGTKVELPAVALVNHEVGVAVRRLPLDVGERHGGGDEGRNGNKGS